LDPADGKAIGINNLNIGGNIYNVDFTAVLRAAEVYGAFPGVYEFTTTETAAVAVDAVTAVLTEAETLRVGAEGADGFPDFRSGFRGYERLGIALVEVWEARVTFEDSWSRFSNDDTLIYHDDFRTWAYFTLVGAGEPSNRTLIPAASLAAGAQGSFYQTDVDINNWGNEAATFRIMWLPRGADNSDPTASEYITLAAGAGARYANAVGEIFGLEPDVNGALVVVSDSENLVVKSRIYNLPTAKVSGTFGQAIAGVPSSELITTDQVGRIIFMSEDPDFRANLGCANGVDDSVRISIDLYDDEGTLLETKTMDLGPWSNNQFKKIFEDYAPINGYANLRVREAGGSFYCYGSVLDNLTSDPITVLPQ